MGPNDAQPQDQGLPPANSLPVPATGSVPPAAQTPVQPVPQINGVNQAASQTPTSAQQSNPASISPQIADDSDLIEKEWVSKAKQIVEQTKNDPYLRNQEINKIKADYIKKRYNKDVRTTND